MSTKHNTCPNCGKHEKGTANGWDALPATSIPCNNLADCVVRLRKQVEWCVERLQAHRL